MNARCIVALACFAALGCNETGLIGRACPADLCKAAGDGAAPSCTDGGCPDPNVVPQCRAGPYSLTRKQLDVYMMVDDSNSMFPWWPQTQEGLAQFFADPASSGIAVGLQFFGDSCDVATYAAPRVPIAALPDNASALRSAFPIWPGEETATLPALQGAIMHARQRSLMYPDNKVVVLLLSDGLPEECNSTVENVTQAAREGFEGSPSVATYVLSFGDWGELIKGLSQFALAGGTTQATPVTPDTAQEIITALRDVRNLALPCEFSAPEPVQLTAAGALLRLRAPDASESAIPRVPDAKHCDAQQDGYYIAGDAPRTLHACPHTCASVNAGGTLELHGGCRTH